MLLAIGNNHLRAGRARSIIDLAHLVIVEGDWASYELFEVNCIQVMYSFTMTATKLPPGSVRAARGFFNA